MKTGEPSCGHTRANRRPKRISDPTESHLTVGSRLLGGDNAEESRAHLERALRAAPHDLDARLLLAQCEAA